MCIRDRCGSQPRDSAAARSTCSSQDRRARRASSASLTLRLSPASFAASSSRSSAVMAATSCAAAPSALARVSGFERCHLACSVSRTTVSTARKRLSMRWMSARGTLPIRSQRSWMFRRSTFAAAMSVTGTSRSACSSSASLASRFAENSALVCLKWASRATKKASCAARKRAQRASSSLRLARPAVFNRAIRSRLGVRALPLGLLCLSHNGLDRPQAALVPLDVPARDLADPLPALLDVPQIDLSRGDVGDRHKPLCLLEKCQLGLEVRRELGVGLLEVGVTGDEEGILRSTEAGPEGVVVLAAGTSGRLPPSHQVAERCRCPRPVRAGRQRLGLGHQLLLLRACGRARLLQLGEPAPSLAVEGRPGMAEPLPEGVLVGPVQTRPSALGLLPLLQENPQLFAGRAPLHAFRLGAGDLLRSLHHRGARLEPHLLGCGALGVGNGLPRGGEHPERVETTTQAVEVADGCWSLQLCSTVASISLTDRSVAVIRASKSTILACRSAKRRT